MNYWKIAPGQKGFCWVEQRDHNCIAVGWNEVGNLDKYRGGEIQTKKRFNKFYKNSKPFQLIKFFKEVRNGDKIIANSGGRIFGFGTVNGKYKFHDELIYKHSKPVNWQFTFWEPLDITDINLSEKLEKSLRKQCTIKLLDKKDGKLIEEAISKIKNPFKNRGDIEGLCFAPQTEQEVIILFSRISQQLLKMKIEYVSTRFPDAIIRIKESKKEGGKWVSKFAEFEKNSSDFKKHGHLKQMKNGNKECDMIICWKHDWKEKPKDIEIEEIRKEIEKIL